MAIECETPVADVVARTFAASDSGDLAGYRTQVVGLAGRHVPPSGRSDAELQALYTETARMVYDQLGKPVGDRIHALGLELTPVSPHRSLDGGSPPGYGGSASCPRWRWPGREGAWLEAWIGLCHRAWPSETLDDLVISLLLAIMTTERQHTLLTRFVPTTPSDAELDAKIDSMLTDVDLVLSTAVALLTER